jgi:hypothetical protein
MMEATLRGTLMKPIQLFAALVLTSACFTVQASPASPATTLQGEVLETQNVDSYTYLRLKTKDGEVWAAVPKTAVKQGAKVTIGSQMTMENFESKSLKKKFDKIVFGVVVDDSAKPAAQGGVAPAAAVSAPVAKVAKATGPDAKNVAEVVQGKAALKDKAVLVRGQVVKTNVGILGKNWLHLQDGSGTAAAGTNDILVTTKDVVAVGDIVTAKGTVRTDVNLGSGYVYPVLIEDAAVRK